MPKLHVNQKVVVVVGFVSHKGIITKVNKTDFRVDYNVCGVEQYHYFSTKTFQPIKSKGCSKPVLPNLIKHKLNSLSDWRILKSGYTPQKVAVNNLSESIRRLNGGTQELDSLEVVNTLLSVNVSTEKIAEIKKILSNS